MRNLLAADRGSKVCLATPLLATVSICLSPHALGDDNAYAIAAMPSGARVLSSATCVPRHTWPLLREPTERYAPGQYSRHCAHGTGKAFETPTDDRTHGATAAAEPASGSGTHLVLGSRLKGRLCATTVGEIASETHSIVGHAWTYASK